jgi:hypothetical protein
MVSTCTRIVWAGLLLAGILLGTAAITGVILTRTLGGVWP